MDNANQGARDPQVPRMSQLDLSFFKEILLEKRKQLLKKEEYYRSIVATTPAEAAGEVSTYRYHMADQASDAMEREKTHLFIQRDEDYLRKINDALARIENGTYGICRITGQLIDPERLKAVPTTTISCQAKKNEKQKNYRGKGLN